MSISKEALAVVAKLNKKFGDGTVVLGEDIRHELIPRLDTGSLTVNDALGGGWPVGQWSEIVGEASHGKTALALQTIAAAQRKDPDFTTVWVAAEEWSFQYAEMCGVDTSRILLIETNVMEEAYEAVVTFCESKVVDLVVIDSLPALIPLREDDNEMGETTPGRGAYVTNQFFRKVGNAMKRSLTEVERPVTGIMINQWREKIGVSHGDPKTTTGGKGKDYAYFVKVDLRRTEWQEIGPAGSKVRIGQSTSCRVIKNKTAPPQRVAFFDFYFDEGGPVPPGCIDYAKEILSVGIKKGVIQQAGGWFYYPDKEGRKWQGREKLLVDVYSEPDLREEITRDVMEVIRIEGKGRE